MVSSTNSGFVSLSSGHVDNLINYVLDVKPYHTKLTGIVERYVFSDAVSLRATDSAESQTIISIGYDVAPYDVSGYDSGPTYTTNLTNRDFPYYLGNFIRLKLIDPPPGVRAIDGWVQLQFKYYYMLPNGDLSKIDDGELYYLCDVIKAYTVYKGVDGQELDSLVVTLTKPLVGTTYDIPDNLKNNKVDESMIVFDKTTKFYDDCLFDPSKYTLELLPSEICTTAQFYTPVTPQ